MDSSLFWAFPDRPTSAERQAMAGQVALDIEQSGQGEGLCDGFRAPDQAIMRRRDPNADAMDYPLADVFALGSSLTSFFWVVPVGDMEAAVEAADQAALHAFPEGLHSTHEDAVITGAWLQPGSGIALVGCMGFGDWAASLGEALAKPGPYDWERATWLGYGGNDNGPHNLLDEHAVELEDATFSPEFLALIHGSTVPEMAQETIRSWQEEHGPLLGGWTPKGKAPKP